MALRRRALDMAFDAAALDATPDAAFAVALDAGLTPGDDDYRARTVDRHGADGRGADGVRRAGCVRARGRGGGGARTGAQSRTNSKTCRTSSCSRSATCDAWCRFATWSKSAASRMRAPVPNAPAWLYGLGNLRGQVLSLIDLRAFFGVGRIKASAGRMVVLRGDSDDITAGVMVDQVHQIVALSPSRFKEAPRVAAAGEDDRVRVGRVRLRQLHDDRPRRRWCARRGDADGREHV